MKENNFFSEAIVKIALPVTLQSVFQASFSVADQIMTGQLGTKNVAAVGLCGKFSSLYSVVAAAVSTAAGIMISQYIGSRDDKGVGRSFSINMLLAGGLAAIFTLISMFMPYTIMSIYIDDRETINIAGECLRILAIGFIPMAASLIVSTLLRCEGKAKYPLYASICSAVINTVLNYILIFGKAGCSSMGVIGASWATTISRLIEFIILIIMLSTMLNKNKFKLQLVIKSDNAFKKTYIGVLFPIIMCEFLWSLGENVYAVIYGRLGTSDCAAMTLTNPVQSLMIGAMTGLSSAAGIYIGKHLGKGDKERAYKDAKKFVLYGIIGSTTLSCILLITNHLYVTMYKVDENVRQLTQAILVVYAFIAPVKVGNMILAGGVIRSGGKTKYVMVMDIIGTWCFGVPLGYIAAAILKFPVNLVYLMISLEEIVRLIMGIFVFRKKWWMNTLSKQ